MCIRGVWYFLAMFYHVSTYYVELHDIMVLTRFTRLLWIVWNDDKELVVFSWFLGYLIFFISQFICSL
jgi:hypothetical protein